MRPESRGAEYLADGVPGNMLGDRRFFRKVKPRGAIEDLKIFMLVQMLNIAPDRVKLTHKFMVSGTDEQLCPALELLSPLPRF